jgi:hypothetical protein
MILWHMHHPSAPSFVHACNNCSIAITSGHRWSCSVCDEFDLCKDCAERVGGSHEHNLVQLAVTGLSTGAPGSGDAGGAGAGAGGGGAQLPAHNSSQLPARELSMLLHASACGGPPGCPSTSCARFKMTLNHYDNCTRGQRAGCPSCRNMFTILVLHARSCRLQGAACPVRQCGELKEQLRRSGSSQQAMDARRRAAQTAKATAGREGVAQDGGDGTEGADGAAAAAAAAGGAAGGAAGAGAGAGSAGADGTTASSSSSSSSGAASSSSSSSSAAAPAPASSAPGDTAAGSAGAGAGSGQYAVKGGGGGKGHRADGSGGGGSGGVPQTPEEVRAQIAATWASVGQLLETYPFARPNWDTTLAKITEKFLTAKVQQNAATAAAAGVPPPPPPTELAHLPELYQWQCLTKAYRTLAGRMNSLYQGRVVELAAEQQEKAQAAAAAAQAAAAAAAAASADGGAPASSSDAAAAAADGAVLPAVGPSPVPPASAGDDAFMTGGGGDV